MRTAYRMDISAPVPPRGASRALHYCADLYLDGPRMWRWRAYVFENGATIVESNGGEPDEQAARDEARGWLIDQAHLLQGADH